MKYFYTDEETWQYDRRSNIYLEELKEVDNYQKRRYTDKKREFLSPQNTISNSCILLEIQFKSLDLGDEHIINDYKNQHRNLIEMQKLANKIGKCLYAIVFDDESFIVYENNKIDLFTAESKVNIVLEAINKKLDKLQLNIKAKKIMVKPD